MAAVSERRTNDSCSVNTNILDFILVDFHTSFSEAHLSITEFRSLSSSSWTTAAGQWGSQGAWVDIITYGGIFRFMERWL